MKTPLIKLAHVSKYYKTKTGVSEGMRDISLEFYNNEFVAITGESGSGKTTLLNVISGLDSYEDGELYYNGLETSHYSLKDFEKFRAKNIAFVFQNYNVIDSYSVLDNVKIALIAENYPNDKINDRAKDLVDKVGLSTHLHQKTSKLSGGQKQRVVIARALAKDAPIILADEPTGNLDSESSKEVLDLLKEISKDKLVILVSHNLDEVDKYATRKVVMENGNIKNDIVLEKTELKEADLKEDLSNGNSFKKGFRIAFKNLLSTPKRTIFTLILSSLVLFSFMYFYSTIYANFINNLFSQDTTSSELVAIKRDGTPYTSTDLKDFKANKHTSFHFDFTYKQIDVQGIFKDDNFEYHFFDVKVKLLSGLRQDELSNGNLPNSNNEIVVRLPNFYNPDLEELKLGDKLTVNGEEFTISGIVYQNRRQFNDLVIYINNSYIYDAETLKLTEKGEIFVLDDNNFSSYVITSRDRNGSLLFKKHLNTDKYQVIDSGLVFENSLKAVIGMLKIFLWIILIIILQVIFLIVYQVLKNIMQSRIKDFSVYRSIGINETEVSLMILFEQLIIALFASFVLITLFIILGNYVTFFHNITRNLNLGSYLLVVIIFSIFSLRQGQKFNKKIFGLTVIESLKEDN